MSPTKHYKKSKIFGNTFYSQVHLQKRPRSNLNMIIKSPYSISYLMAIVMFDLSVTILEIFAIKMFMTLTLTIRMSQGQMYICQSKGHMTLHICLELQYLLYLSPFAKYSLLIVRDFDLDL